MSTSLVPPRCGGLVGKIKSGDCVLVLGPRIAMPRDAADGQDISVEDYLSSKLLVDLNGDVSSPLPLRTAIAKYEQGPGEPALRSLVQQLAGALDRTTTPLHLDLAALPFRLVLQATPDRMMINAFEKTGKMAAEGHYNYCAEVPTDAPLSAPTIERPIVYNLFGRHDQPESMVLTDTNLLDYLVTLTKERPPLPDPIRSTLSARSTQFLFLGFGFGSWWLRLLLKVLDVTGVANRGLSLALEDSLSFADDSKESRGFFEKSIFIQSGDWNALANDLAAGYRQEVDRRPPSVKNAPSSGPRMPLVFVSYASEDVGAVDRLRIALESHGIAIWQDAQNLRAGQNWETKIAECIKRVDYFLFVQTENMDRRDDDRRDGVYNRELKLALNRLEDRPSGSIFIFHATLGQCRPRPEPQLAALHRASIDTDGGMSSLAAAIRQAFDSTSSSLRTPVPGQAS